VTELENDETLQAMWNSVENGGYDFMTVGRPDVGNRLGRLIDVACEYA
jgi:hypothetical protein